MKKFTQYKKKDLISLKEAWINHLNGNNFDKLTIKDSSDSRERHLLSVDIGGTSLKICGVYACGEIRRIESEVELYPMSNISINTNCIWMFIILCIKEYFKKHKEYSEGCLTVSYPLIKENSGYKIDKCGKDFPFKKDNFEKCDPIEKINEMCLLNGVNIKFLGVMNDSIATTVASYFKNKNTVLGIVLGTGTNGSLITKENGKTVIFNSEWGSLTQGIIKNDYDEEVIGEMNGVFYNLLDVMIGGYKINDYLRKMASERLKSEVGLTLKDVLGKKKLNKEEKVFLECFADFKKRSKKILAALTIASVIFSKKEGKMNDVVVCLNGSAFENEDDQKEFKKCVEKLLIQLKLKEKLNIVFDFIKDGSLLGSSYFEFIE